MSWQLIIDLIQIFFLAMTGWVVLYLLFFALAGHFFRKRTISANSNGVRKIAVMIPAYREDKVILNVARDALNQSYPKESYDVVIIADSLMPSTMQSLRRLPLILIEFKADKSTKVKALNHAISQLGDIYDLLVILDADNLMEKHFLVKINNAFNENILAVQGHRTALNTDTPLSILDAASEEINNHIFRKGHRAVGLSSAIIGSGMAFDFSYFRYLISESTAVGGFDKEIELKMLKEKRKIEYLDDAFIYDEKVRHDDVFVNQRRRWLSAQFHYLRKDFFPAFKALLREGNIDYFDKVVQFILPPRALLLGVIVILSAIFIPYGIFYGTMVFSLVWLILLLLCISVFLLSVPLSFYNYGLIRAMVALPKGMWLMAVSLFRLKGANRQFLHTVHGTELKSK